MLLYILDYLGLCSLVSNIDRQTRLEQYNKHPSTPKNFINLDQLANLLNLQQIHKDGSIIIEYLATVIHSVFFGTALYFLLSSAHYIYLFVLNKRTYLPNHSGNYKILHDIKWSCINISVEACLVAVIRMLHPRYGLMYYDISEYGYGYFILSMLFHVCFDEFWTYWTHRWLHTYRNLYLKLHIVHHRSVDITPFAGFAFHPFDAFLQALPTFLSCFFFPLYYNLFLIFTIFTTTWAISIHDNVPVLPFKMFLYATHHTIHHEKGKGSFRNYGKFTSVMDRLMGTYEDPKRVDFGWKRDQKTLKIFDWLNEIYENLVPDNTLKKNANKNVKNVEFKQKD